MVDVESLRYWPILNYVPASLLKNIRLVYVFGHAGSDVLLVTKDDELLVFGFNSSRCLSVEDHRCQYNSVSLNKIEELSKKRIKGFAFCTYSHANIFVLAYLENGEVYSWGNDPANEEVFKTPSLIDSLPKTVTEVACGSKHILALTSDGEVFAWGSNTKKQVNHLNEEVISVPVKITGALSCEHVVKISCGSYFSVVLTSNGIMYSWGENDNGQLGLNMESQFEGTPTRIDLKATCISHIACGDDHVLALDSDGYLFSWGWNDCLQLGFDDIIRQSFPTIVDRRLRFNDVAAYIDLSVAVSFDGVVKVWGKTAGECNSVFISTPCRTIDEAFALFNCGKMYKAIEITSENESVSETLLRSFGVQESSDFKFIVEGKDIYVHKTILKLRSEYFDGMFRNQWREASMSSVEINENYEAMVAYLKYLYTGELNIDSRVAFEVYIIADKYCETNLINLSLRKFREGLDVDNVAELYELAYDREMTSVTDLCINFAAYNMQSVIKSEGFQKWKVDTYRSFFGESRISEACGNRGIYYR